MKEKDRNSIERIIKFPQFTTMNVIDGQAGLVIYSSLIFYSLTIDNILNIIVLLILAGVTITILTGENGILTQTQSAKEASDNSTAKEKVQLEVLGSLGEEGKIDINNLNGNLKNIDGLKYEGNPLSVTNKITKLPARVEVDGYKIFIEDTGNVGNVVERPGINIGDYVNYEPAGGTYEISKLNTYSNSPSNGNDNLTLDNMGMLNWQVLRMYDDGRIDLLGTPTLKKIYFKGSLGYCNGVYLLNDICKTLYSRGDIKARSINLEDMENWLTDDELNSDGTVKVKGGKTAKIEWIDNHINDLILNPLYNQSKDTTKNTVTYVIERSWYTDIYQYEKGCGINTTNVNTTGISKSDEYYTGGYDTTKERALISIEGSGTSVYQASDSGLTVQQTSYDIPINSTNYGESASIFYRLNDTYWIASRGACCYPGNANFGLFNASSSLQCTGIKSNTSATEWGNMDRKLRPVVTLGPDAEITAVEGASTSPNTPHQITKY